MRLADFTALTALAALAALLWPALAGAEPRHGVRSEIGLVYRLVGERALVLDVYRPRAAVGLRPAVVLIHGGSWDSGDRWSLATPARDLAERGFVAATVQYRLSGEAPFPAAVADVRAAVRWLAANGGRFGVDARRIGVFGPSAGGHLALMAATLARGDRQTRAIQACAAWSAPADFVRGMTEGDVVPRPSLAAVERFLRGTFETHQRRFAQASPATHVSADTPPLFLAHGDRDGVVPFSQSRYMREAAERHGVEVTLVRVRHAGHELTGSRADPPVTEAWERTVAFFERHLGPVSELRAAR